MSAATKEFADWKVEDLPPPPSLSARRLSTLVGPALLMVGANIGGGEWLFGPLVTGQYGGRVMWLATLAIAFQVFFNLTVIRYALFCGETIFVGYFRTAPGIRFWTFLYLVFEINGILPYLAANAAVPLAAVILGHVPTAADGATVRSLSYGIFAVAFIPLIFGGKIYAAVEKVMVAKLAIILAYLCFVVLLLVSASTWWEIGKGFFQFGALPDGDFNWATLAAFAAVAGAGGLSNTNFSNYARDKGWGMGSKVGAIPSAVGGQYIKLSHTGSTFAPTPENLQRWRGWMRFILRDQLLLWAPGCILGMALPAMFSYEFVRGLKDVDGNAVAALSAQAIAAKHGQAYWYLTLLCGFLIMAPTQLTQIDGFCRRWTDVIWMGIRRLHHVEGNKAKYVYYTLMTFYGVWGMCALAITPNPLVLAVVNGVVWNFSLAFASLHGIYVIFAVLPKHARPGWTLCAGLIGCAIFYTAISSIAFAQQWPKLKAWLLS